MATGSSSADRADVRALRRAALGGDSLGIRVVLAKAFGNFAVNVKDADGRTALMHAAWQGDQECVRLLMEAGASLDLIDENGATALMFAVRGDAGRCGVSE